MTQAKRAGSRHPEASTTVVRLTEPALADLRELNAKRPQAVRWAFKKMLLLERDPNAGEPLRGDLIGFRKLTVSDNTWRIVWRVTFDDAGNTIVDVAEVWAVGARSDAEVYSEMVGRVARLSPSPGTIALTEAVRRLGVSRADTQPAAKPRDEALPEWLVDRLRFQAGISEAEVKGLTLRDAVDRWTSWTSRESRG